MFRTWLVNNNVEDFEYTGTLLEKASNRAFWEPKFKKEHVEEAERYLGYEWPLIRATDYLALHTDGNRLKQETPHFARRVALIRLLIGELAEHGGRFLPDIVDGVFAVCEESYWGVSAHRPPDRRGMKLPNVADHYIDLFAAETGALIAVVLHTLRDELLVFCREIVQRMEYELQRRIVEPYLTHINYGWMGHFHKVNNWNPWILSNILTVFLLLDLPKPTLHGGIKKMICEIQGGFNAYPADGGCDEGISYWGVSGATLFEFCEQLYRATDGKIDFFADEKMKAIADYPCKAYIGNTYFVNFADGSCRGSTAWRAVLYGYGKRVGNDGVCALAGEDLGPASSRGTYTKRELFNILYADAISEHAAFEPYEQAVLPDIQNAFARHGHWYYAAKGGHNAENHNHNDVGSFMVYYDAAPVLVDPGCGVYTRQTFSSERYEIWTMQSQWHNLPTVNGKQQKDGREYAADGFSFADKTCTVDFPKAYEDGTGLTALTRTVSVGDTGIDLTDVFAFETENNTVAEQFITPLDVEIKDNTAILGGRFALSANGTATITVDRQAFFGDEKLTAAWNTDGMNRVRFAFATGSETTITFTLRCL